MAKYKIAWMPGDGVGNDVMEAAKIALDKLNLDAEYIHADIGWEFWKTEANPLPDRTVEILKNVDCSLFGAITSMPKEECEQELIPELQGKGHVYSSPIVRLRQEFNLRTNLRPCKAYPGNPLNYKEGIDIVVFRENTEDLYSGVEFHPFPDEVRETVKKHNPKMGRFDKHPADEVAVSLRINTKTGCRNIITDAFELAKKTGRKTVTVVEKPNVIRETSGLMVRTAREVAKSYPDIELWETNIDAMCMWLVKNPMDYSVLVTSNMFGDIVSDLCAQLVGGLGFAASGNIGDDLAVFEPTHGSAPKYAGQYKVNPMAMLITARMMLEWLGETDKAGALEAAIAAVIKEGAVRTYDMGGNNTTLEVGEAVAAKL
ncbi:MAG: isocitrate/isopropylmalate dehydrogenase family protein [candidate division Zixibacteria bacterium]|nr:isocitrate/isopropylmalate dehydrogenase family protein [candidate division Zixibacteria bacterium]MDH3938030.1 isocitrate/isopropylmalate dehydrogenase family protein [candidate division Zixibacteria bacterium]MDH4035127.1 isocitrate/isopropylmalate dehydrogenase family protein [candidate division Zixibacteria bacterium]